MARIKNKASGIIHVEEKYVHSISGTIHIAACGASPYSFKSLPDSVAATCKSCLKVLKAKEKQRILCKLPLCVNYASGVMTYCCDACSADAYDEERLSKEEQEMEARREKLANQIKRCVDEGHAQSILLEQKVLKTLENYIRKHADIYENTTLGSIITQIIESHDAWLKEDLF